ncbi:MAG: TonB-dependent receptor [Caulobacterales bacterium]
MKRFGLLSHTALALVMIAAVDVGAASAQSADKVAKDDIIVTARKRNETSLSVPVVITAVSGAELERRAVNSIDGIARLVPQLVVGEGGGTVQGGNIALRGISGADANPFADQAVSFNIDGVQVSRASIRRMAEMDLQQIEILKGPQTLFFGKNSPGGIISMRSADPTDKFSAKISTGYEFNAREWRGDGYVSGPISDTLGFRIAAYGTDMKGWTKNEVPDASPLAPDHGRSPDSQEYALRGTLKYAPTDRFFARLKMNYGHVKGDSSAANVQFVDCPVGGTPQSGGIDDCKADDHVSVGNVGTAVGLLDGRFGDGETFLKQKQALGSLEMEYNLTDHLTLSSITGYYDVSLRNLANFTASYIPASVLSSLNRMNIEEISQEVRLTSSFDSMLNFMIGGFYQETTAKAGSTTFLGADTPFLINNYLLEQKGKASSIFGQALLDITPKLELAGGGRYSHEKKRLPSVSSQPAFSVPVYPPPEVTTVLDESSWNDFSPEVSLTYRPSETLTFFGSYKEGFLSGGFNSGSANFALPLDYDEQRVDGFEAGVKGLFLDGALRTNLALYTYDVTGLQVQVTTQGTIQELKNAGKVKSQGAEFDFTYRMPVDGLNLHGALGYSKGEYDEYFASCYRGQSKALGCAYVPVPGSPGQAVLAAPGTPGSLQDLSNTDLIRAPEWTGNIGFTYETPIMTGLVLGLSGDATHSGSYLTDATSKAAGRSPSYTLLDATVRLATEDERWEVAFIGKNLSNEYYWTRNSDSPFTGTPPGNEAGPSVLGDTVSSISRGRDLMVRVTAKY